MKSWPEVQMLCERLRQQASVGAPLTLNFDGLQVVVHSESGILLEALEAYFRPFLVHDASTGARSTAQVFAVEQTPPLLDLGFEVWPREPGKERLKEEVAAGEGFRVVRKVRTGMQFISTAVDHYAVGPCLDNINQIINFVGSRFMTHYMQRGWQLCHAAGVTQGTGGLAIAGLSGGGKSTLALHLMASGLDYVSNDRILIRTEAGAVEMLGVPKLPRINPGTAMHNAHLAEILPTDRLQTLRQMDPRQLWDVEEKYDVDIDRCFGEGRMQMRADLRAFVILNWSRQAATSVQVQEVSLRQRPDLMAALTKAAGPFYQPGGCGPADGLTVDDLCYLDVLQHIPAFEVTGGVDFTAAVRECTNLLGAGASIRA